MNKAKLCSKMHIPHKIVHEVGDNSQLANFPGVDVFIEEDNLVFAEGVLSAEVWVLVETVWVVSCVKVSIWSQVEQGAEDLIT